MGENQQYPSVSTVFPRQTQQFVERLEDVKHSWSLARTLISYQSNAVLNKVDGVPNVTRIRIFLCVGSRPNTTFKCFLVS